MRTSLPRLATAVVIALAAAVAAAMPVSAAFPEQGNRILYARSPASGAEATLRGASTGFDLFSIRNNGSDRMRVTDSPSVSEYGGYYSPDGDQIVYWGSSDRIYVADADGGHRETLTSTALTVQPNWSKNGKQIVYVRYPAQARAATRSPFSRRALRRGGGDGNLMVMDADGTGKHSIFAGSPLTPGWSPTRAEIAFSAYDGEAYRLYLIPPGGGEPTYVCCKGGQALFADWSPNGNRALFTYVPGGAGASTGIVYSIRRDGTDEIPITDQSFYLTVPRYSNDGERVIFSRQDENGFDLFSTSADGDGGMKRLTDTPNRDEFLNLVLP